MIGRKAALGLMPATDYYLMASPWTDFNNATKSLAPLGP